MYLTCASEFKPFIVWADSNSDSSVFASVHDRFKPFSRPYMLEAFCLKTNPNTCKVHTSHSLEAYNIVSSGGVELSFANGNRASCDLLIRADGVHSKVRHILYASQLSHAEAHFSGTYVYRMAFSAEEIRKKHPNHQALQGFRIVRSTCLLWLEFESLTSVHSGLGNRNT